MVFASDDSCWPNARRLSIIFSSKNVFSIAFVKIPGQKTLPGWCRKWKQEQWTTKEEKFHLMISLQNWNSAQTTVFPHIWCSNKSKMIWVASFYCRRDEEGWCSYNLQDQCWCKWIPGNHSCDSVRFGWNNKYFARTFKPIVYFFSVFRIEWKEKCMSSSERLDLNQPNISWFSQLQKQLWIFLRL